MLKYYGIDKSQAMAFGDGNNDIEMLKAVGNGIAMANASDDLKAVADEICGDVSEDGIYHYCLEKRLIWAADEGDEFCPHRSSEPQKIWSGRYWWNTGKSRVDEIIKRNGITDLLHPHHYGGDFFLFRSVQL